MPDERYLVSARKYRPKRFDDLVAQEHVAHTLRNALVQERLAHAYLFSGPRGVGKTTAARILAQAINCTTPLNKRNNGEPCGQCESCRSFEAGRSLNIIEIDAASNNKVDDIRALREKVRIPPQGAKKKVYIIDEVHMLSKQAFNALLKTLEEPPPHVLFIFATTEPHKILATILSRCQRFDFRRIPVNQVVQRLRHICEQESISYDEESLMLLAKKGNGALRDSLSAFDQAISLCGTELRYDELARALGVVDVDLFFKVTNQVRQRNSASMIRMVDQIMRQGYDLQEFLNGLTEHLRNLLVANTTGSTELIQASEANKQRYAETSQSFGEPDILRLLMIASETEASVKSSTQPRLQVELALLKMAHLERTADLETLIAKIEQLEQEAPSGETASANDKSSGSGSNSAPASPSNGSAASSSSEQPAQPKASTNSSSSSSPTGEQKKKPSSTPPSADTATSRSAPDTTKASASVENPKPPTGRSSSKKTKEPKIYKKGGSSAATYLGQPALQKDTPQNKTEPSAAGPKTSADYSENASASTAVAEPPAPSKDPEEPEASLSDLSELTLEQLEEQWDRFAQMIKTKRKGIGSVLEDTRPTMLQDERLQVTVPRRYHKQTLTNKKSLLQEAFKRCFQTTAPVLTFVVDEDINKNENGESFAQADPFQHVKELRDKNPVIQAIFDQFGGELVYQ